MTTGDDQPIALDPPFKVKLRNGQEAEVTHYVDNPEPWELLGVITASQERALWTSRGRFAGAKEVHGLDIAFTTLPGGGLATFLGFTKIKKGGAS